MTPAHKRLLVFGRVPIPGRVKTRLIPALGAGGAAALYERLLFDTLTMAAGMGDVDAEFWYSADGLPPAYGQDLADRFGVSGHVQVGADLGARMSSALASEGCADQRPALLIGSDCPGFDRAYLTAAFAALSGKDAVLGPALDGGYVLIGVNRSHPRLFADIPWGTDAVLEITRERLREIRWRWHELAPLRDIDRPEDLAHYPDLYHGPLVQGPLVVDEPKPHSSGGSRRVFATGPAGATWQGAARPARSGCEWLAAGSLLGRFLFK